MKTLFSLGAMDLGRLHRVAADHGASEAELAALARLEHFTAERVDVEQLEPLARIAGLPWLEMYPELSQ